MADPEIHHIAEASAPSVSAPPSDGDLVAAIKEMLTTADLTTLSSKKVRLALATKFSVDLTSRKKAIDALLMTEINAKQEADALKQKKMKSAKSSNGAPPASASSDDNDSGPEDTCVNGKSKARREKTISDDDEAMARELQRDEMGMRRTRGAPRAIKRKFKSKKEVRDENGEAKPKRRNAFTKELILSDELSALLGESKMQRSDIVKRVWAYIKENNLQDPKNKQFVRCDEKLLPVFKVTKFKGFGMMKYLSQHTHAPEDSVE